MDKFQTKQTTIQRIQTEESQHQYTRAAEVASEVIKKVGLEVDRLSNSSVSDYIPGLGNSRSTSSLLEMSQSPDTQRKSLSLSKESLSLSKESLSLSKESQD